jgi:murein L,D-transpeptidase YcbB/YkuD
MRRVSAAVLAAALVSFPAFAQWTGNERAVRAAQEAIARATEDGLDPAHYPLPVAGTADFDARFTAVLGAYISDLVGGRVAAPPRRPDILRGAAFDGAAAALGVASAEDPAAALAGLVPRNPTYRALRAALARELAAIPTAPPPFREDSTTIEPGASDGRVPAIRARLGVAGEGFVYDAPLQEAVRAFQAAHNLTADGRIGRLTQSALNEGPASRARRLRVNMDMVRNAAPLPEGPRIEVNVPEFRARVLNGDAVLLDQAVIVGRRDRATPMLRTALTAVQFNPPWGVPMRNAREDLLPRLRRNPDAVIAAGFRAFERVDGVSQEVDIRAVDWSAVDPNAFPYILRQDAGERNALGRIKFIIPNRDDIFMHDTPDRFLFSREQRAFSSGCIRLEQPMALLDMALNWTRARGEAAVAGRNTFTVSAPRAIPTVIGYRTALVQPDGGVRLLPDLYGLDEAYARLMERGPATRIAAR